jgi:glycosyltransferase involved in cell wall biosynthesis
MAQSNSPKIAIVADWLTNMGGAEQVVLALHELFPEAPVYTSTYVPEKMPAFKNIDVRTTWLQKMPRAVRKLHKLFPMIRGWAFRGLDLSEYDIIISSSSAESKQVRKRREGQIHICYCHTPIRYYWSHYEEYRKDPSFGKMNWLVRLVIPILVPPMRRSDYKAAQKVDLFIANSEEIKRRIKKYYKREAVVVYPPVDTARFKPEMTRGDYYVALGRQIPYKRTDLAVAAANELGVKLKVFGNGPSHEKLVRMAGKTVEFFTDRYGDASNKAVEKALDSARGYIFPAEEDFGIVQVEALAAGAPVISYGRGGTLDIVEDGETGVLFQKQTVGAVVEAIKKAEEIKFDLKVLRKSAKRFDKSIFMVEMRQIVQEEWAKRSQRS